MITFKTNMLDVLTEVKLKLAAVDVDKITRLQASSVMAVMRDRIHVQGRDSDGNMIGVYTPDYIKYKRDTPKYGRGSDTKVILSLTRTMENAWSLFPIKDGTGIGFTTAELLKRSEYCQETYKKDIFAPTVEEYALANNIAADFIKEKLGL